MQSRAQPSRDRGTELQHLTPHRLIGEVEPAFGQHLLDIAVAQGEADIQPDRVLDDLGWEAMATVAERGHPATFRLPTTADRLARRGRQPSFAFRHRAERSTAPDPHLDPFDQGSEERTPARRRQLGPLPPDLRSARDPAAAELTDLEAMPRSPGRCCRDREAIGALCWRQVARSLRLECAVRRNSRPRRARGFLSTASPDTRLR
jgi:hypothetical protein